MPGRKHAFHLRRLREIEKTVTGYGLEWLLTEFGLGEIVGLRRRLSHRPGARPLSQPERARLALEQLGPTFIKLGQMLSTRPDLIPPDYVAELIRLQDDVPALPFADINEVIGRELGASAEKLFTSFDSRAVASASIGQVHAARLHDGKEVVVKVQRPGVETTIEEDLAILADLARIVARHSKIGEYFDTEGWVDEFSFTMHNELDYVREGQNADQFRKNFADDPSLVVPRVYWELSARGVLTMDRISGIKMDDATALDKAGADRRLVAETCARMSLRMIFEHGFFHADPHPGNFFVLPKNVVGLVDYGMVGRLDTPLRDALLRIALAINRKDTDWLLDELLSLGAVRGRVPHVVLKRDLYHMIQQYYDLPLKDISMARMSSQLMAVALRHRLYLPADLILLIKFIAMSEGLGTSLDPEFKLMKFAEPYFKRFWLRNRAPGAVMRRIRERAEELVELSVDVPRKLRRLLGQLERGEIAITSRLDESGEALRNFNRAANRIALSVLVAGLTVGLSVLALLVHPGGPGGLGQFLWKGLLALALILSLGLVGSIWRRR